MDLNAPNLIKPFDSEAGIGTAPVPDFDDTYKAKLDAFNTATEAVEGALVDALEALGHTAGTDATNELMRTQAFIHAPVSEETRRLDVAGLAGTYTLMGITLLMVDAEPSAKNEHIIGRYTIYGPDYDTLKDEYPALMLTQKQQQALLDREAKYATAMQLKRKGLVTIEGTFRDDNEARWSYFTLTDKGQQAEMHLMGLD